MSEARWDPAADFLRMTAEEIGQRQSDTYTTAVINRILQRKYSDTAALLMQRIRARSNDDTVTMDAFFQETGFPVWLKPCKIEIPEDFISRVFKDITKTQLYKLFMLMPECDDYPDHLDTASQRGVVFNWPTIDKFMVLHNITVNFGSVGLYVNPNPEASRVHLYRLEKLDSLLTELGSPEHW